MIKFISRFLVALALVRNTSALLSLLFRPFLGVLFVDDSPSLSSFWCSLNFKIAVSMANMIDFQHYLALAFSVCTVPG